MDGMGEIGKRIRRKRIALGWKQQRLADRSGVAQTTISQIERGMFIGSWKVLSRIADALGMSLEDLIKSVGDDLPPHPRPALPALPGTEDLPAVFASAIQAAGKDLNEEDWVTAARFLEWLAIRRSQLSKGGEQQDVDEGEKVS